MTSTTSTETFRDEAFTHYEAGYKNSCSENCCYGNLNSLFVLFSMADISVRGKVIVLKFWECVLLNERYINSQHNFLGAIDFLI